MGSWFQDSWKQVGPAAGAVGRGAKRFGGGAKTIGNNGWNSFNDGLYELHEEMGSGYGSQFQGDDQKSVNYAEKMRKKNGPSFSSASAQQMWNEMGRAEDQAFGKTYVGDPNWYGNGKSNSTNFDRDTTIFTPGGKLRGSSLGLDKGTPKGNGFGIGQPPTFSKTLSDYLKDAQLNQIAADQIRSENKAINRLNISIGKDMRNDVASSNDASRNVVNQIGQIGRENHKQTRAITKEARDQRNQDAKDTEVDISEAGATMIADDKTRNKLVAEAAKESQRARQARQSDNELMSSLDTAGDTILSELQGSEAVAGRMDASTLRRDARSEISENNDDKAANWDNKINIVGALAQQALSSDQANAQMALSAWSARNDALNAAKSNRLQEKTLEASSAGAAAEYQQSQFDSFKDMADWLSEPDTSSVVSGTTNDGQDFKESPRRFDNLTPEQQAEVNAGLPFHLRMRPREFFSPNS